MNRLPSLRTGINLLDTDHATGALQSLVINQLLLYGGSARWIDSHNNASTQTMHRISPDSQLLERIHVARAFTTHQHFSLVEDAPTDMDRDDTILVVPETDFFPATDDVRSDEAEEMLDHSMDRLEDVVHRYQVPVLLTTYGDRFDHVIRPRVDETIHCNVTDMGARFRSDNFETLIYPGNGYVQTTLRLFEQLLKEQYVLKRTQPRRATHHG